MAGLDWLTRLAKTVQQIVPARLSVPQREDWLALNKLYSKEAKRTQDQANRFQRMVSEADSEEFREKLMQAVRDSERRSERYSMLENAARNIGMAGPADHDNQLLRTMIVPKPGGGTPVGIANYYEPGYYRGDPVAGNATYLETLGATGEIPGTGRVLLKSVANTSPDLPMVWQSLGSPETTGFYESRGAHRIVVPKGSELYSGTSLPVMGVEKGSMIREKCGGLVALGGNHGR